MTSGRGILFMFFPSTHRVLSLRHSMIPRVGLPLDIPRAPIPTGARTARLYILPETLGPIPKCRTHTHEKSKNIHSPPTSSRAGIDSINQRILNMSKRWANSQSGPRSSSLEPVAKLAAKAPPEESLRYLSIHLPLFRGALERIQNYYEKKVRDAERATLHEFSLRYQVEEELKKLKIEHEDTKRKLDVLNVVCK